MSTPELNVSMTPSYLLPGVLSLTGSNPWWTGMTMIRVQEFYESAHNDLRGNVFSMERVMDRYAKPDGTFTYASDWMGFNVPGDVVDDFFYRYRGMLTAKESHLCRLIQQNQTAQRYYIIGVPVQASVGYSEHEYAHAAFYLDEEYRDGMTKLVRGLHPDVMERIFAVLRGDGYGDNVLVDEVQAYLSTNSNAENKDGFKIVPKIAAPFREFRKEYFKARMSLTTESSPYSV